MSVLVVVVVSVVVVVAVAPSPVAAVSVDVVVVVAELPSGLAVDVDVVPPSGVVPPQAVNAAASTTLTAARARVWNLRAIKRCRLLQFVRLFGMDKILIWPDHLLVDKLVIVPTLSGRHDNTETGELQSLCLDSYYIYPWLSSTIYNPL